MLHVTETSFNGSIESAIRQGAAAGLIADADLATDLAAVEAAVNAKALKAGINERGLALSLIQALRLVSQATGNPALISGGSLAGIYNAIPGDWSPGFPVGI